MSEAPLFMKGRPAPRTGRALLLAVVIAAVAATALRFVLVGLRPESGLGAVISIAMAVSVTLSLYLLVGLKSGDRGGTKDFLLILFAAVAAPMVIGGGVLAFATAQGKAEARDMAIGWDHYVQTGKADQAAMDREMARLGPNLLLAPAALRSDPGFRKARQGLAEGRAVVRRYRALELTRQAEGRRLLGGVKDPARRDRAITRYDRELDIRRPAEDTYWRLTEALYDRGDELLAVIVARRPAISAGGFEFRSQAGLDAYQQAEDAYNMAADHQRRQARSNADWERNRGR